VFFTDLEYSTRAFPERTTERNLVVVIVDAQGSGNTDFAAYQMGVVAQIVCFFVILPHCLCLFGVIQWLHALSPQGDGFLQRFLIAPVTTQS
jgi:hypothetical protein